jgi:hypothetical protein
MNAPVQADDDPKARKLALLRQPFPEHQISLLPKPYKKDSEKGKCKECGGFHGLPAAHLSYVGHAALTDRLLDADPTWTWEPLALDERGLPLLDSNGGMWIKLTVAGVTRYGYGDAQGKTGGDAMKERIGDALRNAAMRFGAALDLWHKGQLHIDSEDEVRVVGMSDSQRADWLAAIDAAEDARAAETLWQQIAQACTGAGDVPAYAELKAAMAKRMQALKGK